MSSHLARRDGIRLALLLIGWIVVAIVGLWCSARGEVLP